VTSSRQRVTSRPRHVLAPAPAAVMMTLYWPFESNVNRGYAASKDSVSLDAMDPQHVARRTSSVIVASRHRADRVASCFPSKHLGYFLKHRYTLPRSDDENPAV